MIPPTSIDGTDITGATIDGTDVQEITVDGQTVFSAVPNVPSSANLVFHLDASQESLSNNQTTTTITDFSGNNNDVTGDSVTYKTNQINGLPAFDFNEDILDNTMSLSSPIVVGIVVKTTANNQQQRLIGSKTSLTDLRIQFDTGEFTNYYLLISNSSRLEYFATPPLNTYISLVFVADGSNSGIYVDGILELSGTTAAGSYDALSVGSTDGTAFRGIVGSVAEILVYDTSINISDLNNYLSSKYATF